MTDEKQTTTIELTPADRRFIRALGRATGIPSTIGVLRFALRSAVAHNSIATRAHEELLTAGLVLVETPSGELEL